MAGWYHRLSGHEFERTVGDGKDREAWCEAVHGVSDTTEHLSIAQHSRFTVLYKFQVYIQHSDSIFL